MAENIYDEIEIEDMTYDPTLEIYHYPCPCGDRFALSPPHFVSLVLRDFAKHRFEIGIADLRDGETDIAVCPSCSLMIRVIFELENLPKEKEEEEEKKETEDKAQVALAA